MKLFQSAMALTLLLGLSACGPKPSSAVEAFHTAIEEGRTQEAVTMLNGGAAAMIGPEKMAVMLSEFSAEYSQKGGIKNIEIVDETVNENRATVEYIVHFENGTSQNNTDSLIKIGDDWKLIPE